MQDRGRRIGSLAFAAALVVPSCGSDDSGDQTAAEPDEYCARVGEYLDSTENIDTSSSEAIVSGFARSAEAARAAAAVAPPEVRGAAETLASAAEALVADLEARAPRTLEELQAANAEIVSELQAQFGDLEAETALVEEFAADECGLTLDDES